MAHLRGYVLPKRNHIETPLSPELWSDLRETHGRDQCKLLEPHKSHQERYVFLRECDTFPSGTSKKCPWWCWGSCPSIFPVLLSATSGCSYCTGAQCIWRITLSFIRIHVGHTPTTPLTPPPGGWRSIDHRVTPEANLVLVAVPSPGIETIFPSSSS